MIRKLLLLESSSLRILRCESFVADVNYTVTGRVTYGGANVYRARITLENNEDANIEYTGLSQLDGNYKIREVVPGNYTITVQGNLRSSEIIISNLAVWRALADVNFDIRSLCRQSVIFKYVNLASFSRC